MLGYMHAFYVVLVKDKDKILTMSYGNSLHATDALAHRIKVKKSHAYLSKTIIIINDG